MVKKRNTKQKDIILTTIQSMKNHPNIDQIIAEVKSVDSKIGISTIYRNISSLVKEGKIKKITTSTNEDHYDYQTHNHYHFKCSSCGSLHDVEVDYLDKLNKSVESKFQVDNHDIIFNGSCFNCKH